MLSSNVCWARRIRGACLLYQGKSTCECGRHHADLPATMSSETDTLRRLFDVAVRAASPAECVPPHLPAPPDGNVVVVGAGKAAASMALAVEQSWSVELSGLVVTRYGHGAPCQRIEVLEAGHPVPDDTGILAARRMIDAVSHLGPSDLVLALMSGGASSLLTAPAPGISLQDKQAINRALLKSGADITEMNCVRKHLSAIKGGRLAGHCAPAAVHTLLISDVPGDDPSTIGSGPTLPDSTTRREALAILRRYRIDVSEAVEKHLQSPACETPKPGDPIFDRTTSTIVADASTSLESVGAYARQRRIDVMDLGGDLGGEARALGRRHGELTKTLKQSRNLPLLVVSGGETTVTVSGAGRGGRNVEYLLGLAIELDGTAGVYALAADTDGIDGTEDNAGALITPTTITRARSKGLDASALLNSNDAYTFFAELGDLLTTGPTLTNVNDFRAIYIAA